MVESKKEDLIGQVNALTPDFEQAVDGLATEKNVVSVRNFGLAAGIELAPRDGAIGQRGADAKGRAFYHGLLTRAPGDTLVLAPPFVSQPADIDRALERLCCAIRDTP